MIEIKCILCDKKYPLHSINPHTKICIYCDKDFEAPINRFWF